MKSLLEYTIIFISKDILIKRRNVSELLLIPLDLKEKVVNKVKELFVVPIRIYQTRWVNVVPVQQNKVWKYHLML